MNPEQKLDRLLNGLLKDPHVGSYLRLIAGHVTTVVHHVGPARAWETIVRTARQAIRIEEESS